MSGQQAVPPADGLWTFSGLPPCLLLHGLQSPGRPQEAPRSKAAGAQDAASRCAVVSEITDACTDRATVHNALKGHWAAAWAAMMFGRPPNRSHACCCSPVCSGQVIRTIREA